MNTIGLPFTNSEDTSDLVIKIIYLESAYHTLLHIGYFFEMLQLPLVKIYKCLWLWHIIYTVIYT